MTFDHDAYDVAIAGGSFAGLALALQLRGRILLVDHNAIGAGQTSACGTTLGALEAIGALDTVQQLHDDLVLHLAPKRGRERVITYRLPYRFCTFDYAALCRFLADRLAGRGVEIRRSRAIGWRPGRLVTDAGEVAARCVVDATGWRATVASSIEKGYVRRRHLSCGLEAELLQPADNQARGLHFWAGQGTIWPGYGWSFPAGPVARLGVIAYPDRQNDPSKDLRAALDAFLDGPGAAYWSPDGQRAWRPGSGRPTAGRHLHGGFLPTAARSPVVGEVFTVGDAAGQCFGLTGEGIRGALASALTCGALLQRVIDGDLTAAAARAAYRRHAALRAPYWRLLRALQAGVSRMNDGVLARYSAAAAPPPVFWFLMQQYLWPARPKASLS